MNIRRILIDESEKSRILEMHSGKKQLINEATAADFPACVRYAGKISDQIQFSSDVATKVLGNGIYSAIVVVDPSTKYTYNWLGKPKVIVGVPTDPNDTTRSTYVKSYHCGCKNGKLRPISRPYDGKEIQDETKCDQVPGDQGGDQGGDKGGDKGANCKNKTPYDALTGGGLNWKEERQTKLHSTVAYSYYMKNMFDNIDPVFEKTIESPQTYCIRTFGVMDFNTGKESLFYPLDNIREKGYSYYITKQELEEDTELFEHIEQQINNKFTEDTKISYSIFESLLEQTTVFILVKTPYIQQ